METIREMPMPSVEDHPLRYQLVNELHARPFPSLNVPCTAVFLAVKQPVEAAARDPVADRAHLIDLLDHTVPRILSRGPIIISAKLADTP